VYLFTTFIYNELSVINFKSGLGHSKFILVVLELHMPVVPVPEFQPVGGHGVGHFGRQDHFGRKATLVVGPILPESHHKEH
jgi:hypothetical protein